MRGWMIEARKGEKKDLWNRGDSDRGSDDRMSEKFVGEWIKGAKDKSFI